MKVKRILAMFIAAVLMFSVTTIAFAASTDGTECEHATLVWTIDSEATAEHDGQMSQRCVDCGKIVNTQTFAKHTHVAGYTVTLVSPYCETAGEKGICCSICDAVFQTEELPALGHSGGRSTGVVSNALEIVFLIDESGSMSWNDPSEIRKDVAKQLVDQFSPADKGAVVAFESFTRILSPFTTDSSAIKNAIDQAGESGGTNMYRGLETSLTLFPETAGNNRFIILLTDGQSSSSSFDYVAACAEKNVAVYTVGLSYDVNERELEEIANATGGKYYFATQPEDLVDIFKELGREIIYSGGTWVTTITPTCTTAGERVCYCSRCGLAIGTEVIEPVSHSYSACVNINEESHTGTCTNCGKTVTEFHDWSCYHYNGDNTFFKNGTQSRYCYGCGKVETEKAKHTSIIARFFYPVYEVVLRFFNRMPFNWITALHEWILSLR